MISYTLLFVRDAGHFTYRVIRAGKQISECFQSFRDLPTCRQAAYIFLSTSVDLMHDRAAFRVEEHEVRAASMPRLFKPYTSTRKPELDPEVRIALSAKRKLLVIPTKLEDL